MGIRKKGNAKKIENTKQIGDIKKIENTKKNWKYHKKRNCIIFFNMKV